MTRNLKIVLVCNNLREKNTREQKLESWYDSLVTIKKKDCLWEQLTDKWHSYMSTRIYSGSIQVNQHRKLKLLTRGRGSISLQLLFLSHEKRPQTYIFITLLPSRVCKIGVKILVSLTSLDPTFHLSNTHGRTNHRARKRKRWQRDENWGYGKGSMFF